jgi:hypothetical protein
MDLAVWMIVGILLLISILIYFMQADLRSLTQRQTSTVIWLEKVEKKLDDLEKLMKVQIDEARTRHFR